MADTDSLPLYIVSFLIWTIGVAVITWAIVRWGMPGSESASDDYFLGGRSLTWYVVAGSLMLTNLSTEQLVGLNGAIFKDGCLAGTAWETFAALAMCATAVVFLPRYMRSGLSTTTGFLGDRFDLTLRTLVSSIFLVYYTIGLCPIVLYTGALALRTMFELDNVPLWVVSLVIGTVGAGYAIFGGLKAVAVSDCLNGIGLLIVGVWLPVLALMQIGGLPALFEEGDFLKPLVIKSQVYDEHTHTRDWNTPTVPWHVTLTGLMLQNLYYWSTNQLIVQRALGAKSLADGQKGVLFAAAMKVVGFVMLCVPGIVGAVMVKNGVEIDGKPFTVKKADAIYPALVKALMPSWSLGFVAAVCLGSILSTFNSALNSASTLFGLEIYKVYWNKEASEEKVVRVASVFGATLTLASFIIAPQFEEVESIFDLLQRVKTCASLPIIVCFVIGISTTMPDAYAAKVGFVVGGLTYGAGQFLPNPHFLHVFFVCFCLSVLSIFVATYTPCLRKICGQPKKPVPYVEEPKPVVSLKEWSAVWPIIGLICFDVAILTLALQTASFGLFLAFGIVWCVTLVALLASSSKTKGELSVPEKPAVASPEPKANGPAVLLGHTAPDGKKPGAAAKAALEEAKGNMDVEEGFSKGQENSGEPVEGAQAEANVTAVEI
eukprot:TRINITY_DN5558_c0_g2_i1.p1 TRINITY_DN5558_c0_g2~~TRINITY_DN5558_c0_g2_i1.p1  ORF type:complete len:659 (+),score=151.64 TRINITY_DN5558_c0_g2_i1:142-2118(+)